MKHKQSKTISWAKIALKAAAVILIGFIVFEMYWGTFQIAAEGENKISDADGINWCEEYYHERDYAQLYDFLTLYDLYEDCYDVYWEAVNGYEAFIQYDQWHKAAQLGIDGAEQEAQSHYKALEDLARNPEFSQNSRILNGFLERANGN